MTELILALDVSDRKRALKIVESCAPFIDAIKVGYPLVLSTGLSITEDLAGPGLPLIADFKVADIPNTNRLICEAVFSAGFDAVIAHGFVGADAARACVEVAHNHDGAAYIVAEMSHPGAAEFFHGGVAERLAALAERLLDEVLLAQRNHFKALLTLGAVSLLVSNASSWRT